MHWCNKVFIFTVHSLVFGGNVNALLCVCVLLQEDINSQPEHCRQHAKDV